jgi:N-acetylmuramoyl-L-alanine amidase
LPKTLPFTVPGVAAIRSGQWDENTARIVLELVRPGAIAYANPLEMNPSTTLTLNPLTGAAAIAAGVTPERASGTVSSAAAQQAPIVIQIPPRPAPATTGWIKPTPAPTPPAVIRGVSLRPLDDKRAQIVIAASRLPGYGSPAVGAGRFTLDLRNVTLAADAAAALQNAQHPLLSAVQMISRGGSAARLVVDLTRAVAYTVSPLAGGSGLVIELALPKGAGGSLAGKLVVVDPGHGAHDSGAKGINGHYEKNVNLAIGLKLRDELQAMGANVLMTRANDTFIPLGGRPGGRSYIANQAGADFYVSVHADSVRNRSRRGSTVYYHKQFPHSRALAQTIAERFGAMGGIPTGGPRSDSVLYPSGLSVLREARMVSVLVECGYMTNLSDANLLVQSAMQQKIARSIADGLRNYVEGYPDQDTRNVNPRPEIIEDPNAVTDPGEADPLADPLETDPRRPRR